MVAVTVSVFSMQTGITHHCNGESPIHETIIHNALNFETNLNRAARRHRDKVRSKNQRSYIVKMSLDLQTKSTTPGELETQNSFHWQVKRYVTTMEQRRHCL